jgi:hypothetical protein
MKLLAFGLMAAGIVQPSPVERITAAAYRDYLPQLDDRFAAETVKPAAGESFRMAIPLGNGDKRGERSGSAYYSYSEGVLTLSLVGEETERDRLPLLLGKPRVLGASTYQGQNSYGASATVRSERVLWQGVALVDGPAGEQTPQFAGVGYVGPHDYWHKVTLAGPQAKTLALDTDMIVEGHLAPLPDGRAAACKTRVSDPTLDHPQELLGIRCYAGAKIDRVAFVRRSTGAVLKEWKR